MLTAWDDFPIHQTALPVAHPQAADGGRYDRYWFTAFDEAADWQLGVALGVYPNRGVVDGAFSVVHAGVQESVYASAPLDPDRATRVGPLRLEILEPQRVIRVVLDETEGLAGDLTFEACTPVIEEGPLIRRSGLHLLTERTRTEQLGRWSGTFRSHGRVVECAPARWPGARDRSWGVRAAPPGGGHSSIYFSWALLHFPDECVFAAVNEDTLGRREARTGAVLPLLDAGASTYLGDTGVLFSDEFEFDVRYAPGTRHAESAVLTMGPRGAIDRRITIEPRTSFQMKGLGYSHPSWRHGTDHGGLRVGRETWAIADLDPLAPENVHAGQACRVRRADGTEGIGYFDHIAVGAHLPTGLPDGLIPLPPEPLEN